MTRLEGMDMNKKERQRQKDLEKSLCCNPFRKRRCGNADIEVYLMYKRETLPICHSCWGKLSKKDWTEKDFKEEFVYRPCTEIEGLVLTVRKQKGSK